MEEYASLTSPATPSSPFSTGISPPGSVDNSGQQSGHGKVCGVCGDRALGCNFNAITCESCKAFFRRNALKGKEFRCPFENNCKIDQVTRRFCQKCRLKKCLDIGMKKEFIMSEEERNVKRRKIEENRIKKCKSGSDHGNKPNHQLRDLLSNENGSKTGKPRSEPESSFSDSDVSASPLDTSLEASPKNLPMVIHSMVKSPPPVVKTEQSAPSCSDTHFHAKELRMVVASSSLNPLSLDTVDDLLNTAIRSEYNVGVHLVRGELGDGDGSSPVSPVRDRQLNEMERGKLHELVVANKALWAPLSEDGPIKLQPSDVSGDPTLLNVINLTDIAIRRIIKMAKKLAAFKTLCQEDQIALLKGGCTELMILRSVMTYDADKGCWKIPHTESHMNHIKVAVLKEARGNVYEEHQRFVQSFDPLWRADEHIILLLSAIALFDPGRPNVVHRDAIRLEQESYYYLLRRYLEATVGGCQARSMFLKLIQKVSELHILNEKHVRVYLDVNPKEVEPLLIEIFDLKSR